MGLFRAQGFDRVNPGGAGCRHSCCDDRRAQDNDSRSGESERARHLHFRNVSGCYAREGKANHRSSGHSDNGDYHALRLS